MSSDPASLWLWCKPAAMVPIRPLVWEPPYGTGAAQEMAKRPKKKKKKKHYWCILKSRVPSIWENHSLEILNCLVLDALD